ncbi:DMT family transporter [Mycobacterium sp.]|uniref:DMT family transporter n=1 Tax=Mycobacterium sp. TaxID=1785 RepID=UPI002D9E16D0|nr:DMT family transporter [Mycobacterium sp.]
MSASQPKPAGLLGVSLAALGAIAYGIATVIGRALADAGVDSATALGIRFAVAAMILAGALRLRGVALRPPRGSWLPIVLLGAVGYSLESTLFYLSLGHGTAAACILLFYAYPAIVTVIEFARGRERMTTANIVALSLSLVGTAVVVVVGRDVSISLAGIVFALAAATVYALYLVAGREIGRSADAMTTACWVAVGAAASSALRGLAGGTLQIPSGHLLQIVGYGVATAVAFGLTFAALARIGASQTAVVMTLEAASTVAIASVVLGEGISPVQAFGGLAILAAAAVIARSHRRTRPHNARALRRVGVQTRSLAARGPSVSATGSASSGGRPCRSPCCG